MTPSGKKLMALCVVCLSPLLAFNQQFNYTAELDRVDSTGFYAIAISPQLSPYIKTNLADIRIRDEKSNGCRISCNQANRCLYLICLPNSIYYKT